MWDPPGVKSSLLLLAVVLVQQILALGAGADEAGGAGEAIEADVGGGEGGESSWSTPAEDTPANAAAPAGGVI